MAKHLVISAIISIILCVKTESIACFDERDDHITIIISLDAFKPEYLRKHATPFLNHFWEYGVVAPYMENVFPTKTFVNHFSIATGLYACNHGVTANSLYSRRMRKSLGYSYELFHYKRDILPIWALNELAGGTSGVMMWPGSDYEYCGVSSTHIQKLSKDTNFNKLVDTLISWIKHPTQPSNLNMMYLFQPDEFSHAFGPESEKVMNMVMRIDTTILYLLQRLRMEHLLYRTNIVIVSDHGMEVCRLRDSIDLYKYVRKDSCEMYGSSPVLQVIPTNLDKKLEAEICKNLTEAADENKNFTVYCGEELPKRWYIQNPDRFGPITVVAKAGHSFQDLYELAEWFREEYHFNYTDEWTFGCHGYDNENDPEMRPTFMASGPAFQSGIEVPPFHNTDLYGLFATLINIKNSSLIPKTDTTLDPSIKNQMLRYPYVESKFYPPINTL